MLSVGVPKEIKTLEKRVALTPEAVGILHQAGNPVFVEKGAGLGSGFSDENYKQKGAVLVDGHATVFEKADLLQKVKEPLPAEYSLFRHGQTIFCFLHLASPEQCGLVKALTQSRVTAVGYETLEKDGALPLLAPMSEIAGGLAASYASFFHFEGIERIAAKNPREIFRTLETIAKQYPLLRNIPHKPGRTVIFGAGRAGQKAIEVSLNLGMQVSVIEKNEERRRMLQTKGISVFSPDQSILSVLERADVLIGCVHSKGRRAEEVVSAKTLKGISSNKKILMDVSIDQGGNFPEAKASTYENPVYLDSFGNLHFTVPNIPSLAGQMASLALSEKSLPYTLALAKGLDQAFKEYPELRPAVNVQEGKVLIPGIERVHQA